MATQITLPKGSLITFGTTQLSEQGRTALEVSPDPIVNDVRLANGSMRRYYVASKKKFKFSWTMLPALDGQTFDGKAGRNTLASFYVSNIDNTFTLKYKEVDGSNNQTDISTTVFIESYSESLEKRWGAQFWNVSMSLVEQ
jgi:hypothetical protein